MKLIRIIQRLKEENIAAKQLVTGLMTAIHEMESKSLVQYGLAKEAPY